MTSLDQIHSITEDQIARLERAAYPTGVGVVEIEEFFDLTLPQTRENAKLLAKLKKEFPNQIAVIRYHLPASKTARQLAYAAQCAREYDRFELFYNRYLQECFGSSDQESLFEVISSINMPLETFSQCWDSPITKADVKKDMRLADRRAIEEAPLLIVGETIFTDTPSYEELREAFIAAQE